MDNAAKVQHVTKTSSDELLRKFAEVGSESDHKRFAKKELRLSKRRRSILGTTKEGGHCESPSNGNAALVEMKSLLPPVTRRSAALFRRLGRAKLRARDLRNKSIFGTIGQTWRKTMEGASRVLLEKQYNRHKRLINDIA